jgi:glycosyltransferase involved in cell wall biosynthesis
VWLEHGTLVFDRKFYDGILMYVSAWSGSVHCLCQRALSPVPGHDVVRKQRHELPFHVQLLEAGVGVHSEHLLGSSIVLASADAFDQLHISALCRQLGIACVYVIEYIPETRYQIVALEAQSTLQRWKQSLFVWRTEKKRQRAFALADGLQCNGVAAHAHYQDARNSLLYFDTRTRRNSLISAPDLDTRLRQVAAGKPLRLAFSGRLIGMKGADHLIRVASGLRARGLDFHLTIYGAGELETSMRQEVQRLHLQNLVSMPGSVDFDTRLIPEIKAGVDLYLMLHRQSDPSCTYLETLACGIPIVGYANQAFTGILDRAAVGVRVPMDDVAGVVSAIERLDADRALLERQSRCAAEFALAHSFEDTFAARIAHLRRTLAEARRHERPPTRLAQSNP